MNRSFPSAISRAIKYLRAPVRRISPPQPRIFLPQKAAASGSRSQLWFRTLTKAQYLFFALGILALGWCAFVYADMYGYQVYESSRLSHLDRPVQTSARKAELVWDKPLKAGALIGRIEIPRLNLSAILVQGVNSRILRHAVGHIPGTALPGENGNLAIAGHRDTFFRPLQSIRTGDLIKIASLAGSYDYRVERAEVVQPDDVQVLKATGKPTLTLVTCYPFHYIGPAPRRFVVSARLISPLQQP